MQKWQYILLGLILGLLASASILLISSPPKGNPISLEEKSENQYIKVHISGAVYKPGIYSIKSKSRVDDIITLAGGLTEDADLDLINLAEHIYDADRIFVPSIEKEVEANQKQIEKNASDFCSTSISYPLNINKATQDELNCLPGIGPLKSLDIIHYRQIHGPYESIDELRNVEGIGEIILKDIRPIIVTGFEK